MKEIREYEARVVRVVDGDTLEVEVDLGFAVRVTMTLRLDGIDCPDLPDRAGKAAATDFALRWLGRHPTVVLLTRKTRRGSAERDKYGRIVASVHSPDLRACLNDDLVAAGQAVRKSW